MVTIPPEVVRIRASSTVFVKASSLVNLDFGAMSAKKAAQSSYSRAGSRRERKDSGVLLDLSVDLLASAAVRRIGGCS